MKIGLVGTGYRAEFYLNASNLDNNIEITNIYCHSKESYDKMIQSGYKATMNIDDFIKEKYDFVVVSIKKDLNYKMSKYLMDNNINVVQETPAFTDINDYKDILKYKDKIVIAEQYKYYQYYNNIKDLIDKKYFGNIKEVMISELHDYHMISIMRYLFELDFNNTKFYGNKYKEAITKTKDRYNEYHTGELKEITGKHIIFNACGIRIIYDFTGEEYRSPIRSKHLIIRGDRGELIDNKLKYLDEFNNFKEMNLDLLRFDEDIKTIRILLYKAYDKFVLGKQFDVLPEIEDAYISYLMNTLKEDFEEKEIKL